jgi:hypothetical protein
METAMTTEINLELFCSSDRPELARPFSAGSWSYATNGHILVRVARRDDVAEIPNAPNAAAVCETVKWPRRYKPLPEIDLSEPFEWDEELECQFLDCGWCRGKGKKHDCPNCKCECPQCSGTGKCKFCNGTGKYTVKRLKSARIGSASYNSRYLSWLSSLPSAEIGPPHKKNPLAFRFDGGEGLLMPLSSGDE